MSQYSEDGIVDVEERTKEVGKILNDPTLFPVEFLSWIKRFIEQSGIELPVSAIIGGFKPGSGSVRNLAAGIILPYAGTAAPQGSVPCHGQSLSRAEYGLLFAEIGTTWGSVNAQSFNAPDLRDRTLFGAGSSLAVGWTDGQAYGVRAGHRHRHSTIDPGHYHHLEKPVNEGGVWSTNIFFGEYMDAQGNSQKTWSSATNLRVGPDGVLTDSPNWAGVLYCVTTGQ